MTSTKTFNQSQLSLKINTVYYKKKKKKKTRNKQFSKENSEIADLRPAICSSLENYIFLAPVAGFCPLGRSPFGNLAALPLPYYCPTTALLLPCYCPTTTLLLPCCPAAITAITTAAAMPSPRILARNSQ